MVHAALFVGLVVGGCSSESSGGGGTAGSTGGGGGGAGAGGVAGGGGSNCAANDDCDAGDYCKLEECAAPGTCEERPTLCTDILMPVCGCNGVTYGNACEAGLAGVSVESECACDTNDDCVASEYCASDVSCDEPGECVARPMTCPLVFDPVCGCNDTTYNNACEAAAAGVRVASDGECP